MRALDESLLQNEIGKNTDNTAETREGRRENSKLRILVRFCLEDRRSV